MANIHYSVPEKKAVRDFLLKHNPRVYEWYQVRRWKIKDWLWWALQKETFEKLVSQADKPTQHTMRVFEIEDSFELTKRHPGVDLLVLGKLAVMLKFCLPGCLVERRQHSGNGLPAHH